MAAIYYGFFLASVYRFDEARRQVDAAIELDPLSPFVHACGALILYLAERNEEALPLAEKSLALHPDFALALYALGFSCCELGQYERAHDALERLVVISKRAAWFVGMLGFQQALAGQGDEAQGLLQELEYRKTKEYITPIAKVMIYLGLGDRERAFEMLRACIEDETPPLPIVVSVSPYLKELHSEPRFAAIFRRLGVLPPPNS
jgi:tetratricopeptide (TPR) repeat protein